jgi:ubiquinone/menaquinone biosynthesis C-methylase UbiE
MDIETIDTYNAMAIEYDTETTDFWERFPVGILEKFSEKVSGPVLDVGCGPGRDGLLLKNRGVDITGVDASEEMVRIATSRGLSAVVGDFMALPFPDDSFGGVWAYTSLIHVPKSEVANAFAEIARVLKTGGILGLGMIEGDSEGYRESSGVSLPRWFSFYTKEEIETLLTTHDFEVLHFETFKPGSKSYLNFITRKIS